MNPLGNQKAPLYIGENILSLGEYYIVGTASYHKDWYEPVYVLPINDGLKAAE
jgi:hypothetical protein